MNKLCENIQQSRNYVYLIPESNGPIKYRKYNYAIPEGCTEHYIDEVDLTPGMVHDMLLNKATIKAGFMPDKMPYMTDDNNVNWLRKEFRCEVTIPDLKKAEYDREFFLVQTSNRSLEMTYDKAIAREDFYGNILNYRDVVLDTVNEMGLPYSTESYIKLLAGEKPPHERILTLSDCPDSKVLLDTKWGRLRNIIRYQEFYVHLVRGVCDNGEWIHVVLHTIIWYIYWNWCHNIYQCGIKKFDVEVDLSKININRTCNKDQFLHFIDLESNQLFIFNYPNYDCEKQLFDEIFTILYSRETDYRERAGGIRIEVGLFEFTSDSEIPAESIHIVTLSIESNLLFVQNLEKYKRFCSFLLLKYSNNQELNYILLHTCDWNIYSQWFEHITGEKCKNSKKTLQDLSKIKIFQTCNERKFKIWIEKGKRMQFNIFNYPDFTFVEDIFRDQVKNVVIDTN